MCAKGTAFILFACDKNKTRGKRLNKNVAESLMVAEMCLGHTDT